jgi:hypothetical protein
MKCWQWVRHNVSAFIAIVVVGTSQLASAASMSDLWWNPSESGWGANIIENQGVLFITLFVYGPDGRPTWYSGTAVEVSAPSGRTFNGDLVATTGPYLGAFVFNPTQVTRRPTGSIVFHASSPVAGTLTYTVDGVVVSKSVQRLALNHINLSGTYYGAIDALSISTCSIAGVDQPIFAVQTITATVNASRSGGSITMSFSDSSGSFFFSGTYTQFGSLYEVTGTLNFAGSVFNAAIRDFTADDDGIRGNLLAQGANGCILNIRFSAVKPG